MRRAFIVLLGTWIAVAGLAGPATADVRLPPRPDVLDDKYCTWSLVAAFDREACVRI
jgi:hypothetical protein